MAVVRENYILPCMVLPLFIFVVVNVLQFYTEIC